MLRHWSQTRRSIAAAIAALITGSLAAVIVQTSSPSAEVTVRAQPASVAAGFPSAHRWWLTPTSTSTTTSTQPAPPPTTAAPHPPTTRRAVAPRPTPPTVPVVIQSGPDDCSIPSRCPAMRQCENGGSYAKGNSPGYFGAYQFSPSTWASAAPNAKGGAWGSASADQQDAAADWLYAHSDPVHQWPICHKHLARYRR